jgi:hypothetical protein
MGIAREHQYGYPILGLQETQRLPCDSGDLLDEFTHAPADIKYQQQRERLFFAAEIHDRLNLVVLANNEVLGGQPS